MSADIVLVTGGTGFIGSHLVARLVETGARLRCLIRRTSSLAYLPASHYEPAYGDLATGEGLEEAVAGAGAVFHVAGVTKALAAQGYDRGNTRATENLVRTIEEHAEVRRLVHVSSLAAIGPGEDGTVVREDTAAHPLTRYGRSKLAAEQAIRRSRAADRTVIVRPPVVYGPRDTDVYHLFRAAARGVLPRIGRAESRISIIYVEDLVDALIAAATSEAAPGRAYFVANDVPITWTEFAETAAELMGRRIRTVTVLPGLAWCAALAAEAAAWARRKPTIVTREKLREGACPNWVCDVSAARHELGFRARTPLREGMARTIAWYRKAGWLK
jgi:nucleoside-diphosphate-sugar epimerase